MSYESDIKKRIEEGEKLPEKVDMSTVKYFWQSNPFVKSYANSIPKFLRKLKVLALFSDNELRNLSQVLHHRSFGDGETIFKQGDLGIGFYFLLSGQVDIVIDNSLDDFENKEEQKKSKHIVTLDKGDYFGELALLQERSIRNATAIAQGPVELLGIFKPDLDQLTILSPAVATKLIQSVSIIVANRLYSITQEVRRLKYKIKQMEGQDDNTQ